ncbi:hypothetical protein SAMN05216524_10240 [Mucilaginibacter sp. OK098]|nr:hypothetical protein SAMN05216524_10240 [Mucilaginibacter sp. OK098]
MSESSHHKHIGFVGDNSSALVGVVTNKMDEALNILRSRRKSMSESSRHKHIGFVGDNSNKGTNIKP